MSTTIEVERRFDENDVTEATAPSVDVTVPAWVLDGCSAGR